ncbi:hypothetical protein J7I85_12455, partial [Arthrobacter sp. ISL-65]|nr:hypothetical protein [Arthrobacter sp. ISL-65]
MSENNESDARKDDVDTPNPAVEGESGQYASGDHGDAGKLDAGTGLKGAGEYAEGDYGEAGSVDTAAGLKGAGEYAEGDYG